MPKKNNNGLTVATYPGDAVLFAFDVEEDKAANLAGFSIHCIMRPTEGLTEFLKFQKQDNL